MAAIANQPLVLHVDDKVKRFSVALPTNPTTGYELSIKSFDKTLLTLVSERVVASNTKRIGASSLKVYVFERKTISASQNSTDIIFSYKRPWDKEQDVVQSVIVKFYTHID